MFSFISTPFVQRVDLYLRSCSMTLRSYSHGRQLPVTLCSYSYDRQLLVTLASYSHCRQLPVTLCFYSDGRQLPVTLGRRVSSHFYKEERAWKHLQNLHLLILVLPVRLH
jgi:hypothetical protein